MNIFISSIAFNNLDFEEIEAIALEEGYAIEFSANLPATPSLKDKFEKSELDKLTHNYFPPPVDPFVLNLASLDSKVEALSLNHCLSNIKLVSKTRLKAYAAHAGFCFDPEPEQLGVKFRQPSCFDRSETYKAFNKNTEFLIREAKKNGVTFLIENNVLAPFNLREDGLIPLFCVSPDEMVEYFEKHSNDYFGLLLDTAHLKVSSNTLGFNLDKAVEKLTPFIRGVHHSDNNGEIDSNQALTSDYWFLDHMKNFKDVFHVIEVKNIDNEQIGMQINILQKSTL